MAGIWEKYKMFIIVGVIILLLAGWFVGMYNGFVAMDQNVKGSWSEVESQYQRQANLVPNLVSSVKGYAQFEQSTLTEITAARSKWQSQTTVAGQDEAGNQLYSALSKLLVVYENYPDLKTVSTVSNLMDELAGTQNRITVARGRYIDAIKAFNTGIKMFPANVFAGMWGFTEKTYYQAAPGAMETPTVPSTFT